MLTKPCIQCRDTITKSPSRSVKDWHNRTKYCSKKCQYEAKKGIRYSPQTEFKKGRPELPKRLVNLKRGEYHHNWKGEGAGYGAIHEWVRLRLGTPRKCYNCGTTQARKYEWASLKHKYKRDLNNWRRLCTKCHRNYDYGNIQIT